MSASSVSGISGPGSAENNGMKGPGNGRNQYAPLVSPHVISANVATLDGPGGTKIVVLPAPYLGDKSKYLVFAHSVGAGAGPVTITQMNNDGFGNFASFQLTGTANGIVNWMIVNRGVI